jgi:hypothetical protein
MAQVTGRPRRRHPRPAALTAHHRGRIMARPRVVAMKPGHRLQVTKDTVLLAALGLVRRHTARQGGRVARTGANGIPNAVRSNSK